VLPLRTTHHKVCSRRLSPHRLRRHCSARRRRRPTRTGSPPTARDIFRKMCARAVRTSAVGCRASASHGRWSAKVRPRERRYTTTSSTVRRQSRRSGCLRAGQMTERTLRTEWPAHQRVTSSTIGGTRSLSTTKAVARGVRPSPRAGLNLRRNMSPIAICHHFIQNMGFDLAILRLKSRGSTAARHYGMSSGTLDFGASSIRRRCRQYYLPPTLAAG